MNFPFLFGNTLIFFICLSFPRLALGNSRWKTLIFFPFSQRCPSNYKIYFYLISGLKQFLCDSCEQFQPQPPVCKYPPFQSDQSTASRNGIRVLYDFVYYQSKQRETRIAIFLCLCIIQMLWYFVSEQVYYLLMQSNEDGVSWKKNAS